MDVRNAIRLLTILTGLVGASFARAQVWPVDGVLLPSAALAPYANFGTAMAVGDLDGDGYLDLAMTAPGLDSGGRVRIFRGGGLTRRFTVWDDVAPVTNGSGPVRIVAGDFFGDGHAALAIGEPGVDVTVDASSYSGAGRVLIERFSEACQCFEIAQTVLEVATSGLSGPANGDYFGDGLAVGDWNEDGFQDLAVGVPGEVVGGSQSAGAVEVFYGSGSGLQSDFVQGFRAGANGLIGTPGSYDEMGLSMAAGDFDGDGYADLAIGAPGRAVAGTSQAGEIHVLRGSPNGLTTLYQELFSENNLVGVGSPGLGDQFGLVLVAGRFSRGGPGCVFHLCPADLAIGIPLKTVDSIPAAGEVVVARGGAGGVQSTGAIVLTVSASGFAPAQYDYFGTSLAAGSLVDSQQFLGARFADLAVGAPNKLVNGGSGGYVQLFFGGSGGIGSSGTQAIWGQDLALDRGIDDNLGGALAIADFDGDGAGDVAVSAPEVSLAGTPGNGAIAMMFGAFFADGFESGDLGAWTMHTQ